MPRKDTEKLESRSAEFDRLHTLIETGQTLNDEEIIKAYQNGQISLNEKSILTNILHRRNNKIFQRINKREP